MLLELLLAMYAAVSLILFCFPALLHKTKSRLGKPRLHSSHRGGSAECVENTLPAFHHAVSQGSELLELDVHLTRDRQVVVNHDPELSRQCGVQAQVFSFDYAQLPPYLHPSKLPLPPQYHPPGAVLGFPKRFPKGDATRMPLLDEVFKAFPDVWINIDIKALPECGAAELVQLTHALIVKHGRQARTVWGSSKDVTNRACHAMDPSIPTYFSSRGVLKLLLLFYTGLLPFVPLHESFLEIPLLTAADLTMDPALRPKLLYAVVGWLIRSRALFWHLRRRGVSTWAWVYHTDEAYDVAFGLGVDGVMTDRPSHLRCYLDQRGMASAAMV